MNLRRDGLSGRKRLRIDELIVTLERLQVRMAETPVPQVQLCLVLLEVARGITDQLTQLVRPHELTAAEFLSLTALFARPDGIAHPSALCNDTTQSPATMSRIGDQLVNLDLISRDLSANDRRRVVFRITEKGEELVRRLARALFLSQNDTFDALPDSQLAILTTLLGRLVDRVNQFGGPATRCCVGPKLSRNRVNL